MQFERAIRTLIDSGVGIGGLSATFHGSARVTCDLDICYSRASGNVRRLAAALATFHPRPGDTPAGLPIATPDLRGLIQAKRAAGRDKDLAALIELESLLEAGDE